MASNARLDSELAEYNRQRSSAETRVRTVLGSAWPPEDEDAPLAISRLVGMAADEDGFVRERVAMFLGAIGKAHRETVPSFIATLCNLLDDRVIEVRTTTADSLGGLGGDAWRAVPQLIAIVEHRSETFSPGDHLLTAEAVRTLGLIGPAANEAIAVLEKLAVEVPSFSDDVRRALRTIEV